MIICFDGTEGIRMAKRQPAWCGDSGFTLVEVLIAMFISLLVAAALATAYQTNQRVKTAQDQVVEMQQNLRGAFFVLQRELRMAGLDRLETAEAGIVTATRNGITFTQDIDPAGDPMGTPPTWPGDGKKIKNPPDVAGEMVRFTFQPGVDANNDGQADNGVVPLQRDIFDGPGGATNPIAIIDNLAALEFCYRTEKMASTDPCTTAPAAGELDRIREVTVSMLIRATAADPAFNGNGQTFQAGSGQQWVAPNDQFRRRLLVSTIQLRNMGL